MGKKSSANTASKISSSSALATSTTSSSSNRSSILKSSFAPSYLQLHLFASVIQSFESQQLRIHETSSGRLKQQHSISANTSVNCLDWGCYGPAYREKRSSQNKKRKRVQESQEDVVVAYGTSDSEVAMYSPAEGKLVGVLRGGHQRGIKDFKFHPSDNLEAWSVGGDGQLVQWDLRNDQTVRTIPLADTSIQTLCSPSRSKPEIICASFTLLSIALTSGIEFEINHFDAFKTHVTTILRSGNTDKLESQKFLAADHDRYVNLYECTSQKIARTLITGGGVDSVDLFTSQENTGDELLAITTTNGLVDLFWKPFHVPGAVNGDMKSRRKLLTRKADATIKLVESTNNEVQAPISTAHFNGPDLILVSVDSGVNPIFQKVRWQDEGSKELLFGGMKEVQRVKPASMLNAASMNGVKDLRQTHLNESRTVVANGMAATGLEGPAVVISSSDSEEDYEGSGNDAENGSQQDSPEEDSGSEGDADDRSDAEMNEAEGLEDDAEAEVSESDQEPSFGDLVAQPAKVVSITNSLTTVQTALAQISAPDQALLPSGMSFGTVLAQSLRTNDQSLLETCLHVMDETVIQNTTLRLDSSLAASLLIKLAERLADRPGRYGHLLTWVKTTMIAHGGAIAGQANVAAKLRTLYQVLSERSRILPSILLLKGKLEMMNAQQNFRAQSEAHRRGLLDTSAPKYVAGEEDNWSSDEDLDEMPATTAHPMKRVKSGSRKDLNELMGESESSDEAIPLVNGGLTSDEEEDDDDVGQELKINGIIDDEAEESEGEDDAENAEGSEEESEGEDEEEGDEDEEDEEENDSEMNDFINDGEVSFESEDELDRVLDDADSSPPQPARKKSKHH